MRIAADWLSAPGTQAVLGALGDAGFAAYAVGGCVRNTLLGMAVSDVDIATSARPELVSDIGEKAGFRVVPTGLAHGTVTLVADGRGYEVTSFRRDVETDGRHAVVTFSDRIEDDAARRDFTMNALYADAHGAVHDPLGGLPDLHARRVRFVGEAGERIREDYLRILRFFRFHAWYGAADGGLDPDGLAACAAGAEGLARISRERIGAEMRKLLAAPDPATALGAMAQSGVLAQVLPGAAIDTLFAYLAQEPTAEPMARLAALGGEDVAESLRLSRAEQRRLETLTSAAASTAGPAELAYRHGPDAARHALALRAALTGAPPPADPEPAIAEGARARFPLRAADLPHEGKALGEALARAERAWIDSGFTLSRAELRARVS